MMKLIPLFLLLLLQLYAQADSLKEQFCSRSQQEILDHAGEVINRLAFENNGGMLNGGVCWWHSRFERSADYLALFRPDLEKPTLQEAKKIIHKIMLRRQVVQVPGYKNLREFSADFHELIQKQLNRWQVRDGLGNQLWVVSISGKSKLPAQKLEKMMHEIYKKFNDYDSILTLMVQFKGPVSHMWNLIDIEKTDRGYRLMATDSNYGDQVMSVEYRIGDTGFTDYYQDSYVFYPILNRLDLKRINKARVKFCTTESN